MSSSSRTPEHYSIDGNGISEASAIRKKLYELLDENPLLSPKQLCKMLDLPYSQYRNYVTKERSNWKYYHKNERGSKCCGLHCFKAKVRLDLAVSCALRSVVEKDLENGGLLYGWRLSRARNRFLVWEGRLGRVVWFGTGTLLFHVRRPGNLGRAKQLFCDAFGNTGLIGDVKVLVGVADRIFQKSVHVPYPSRQRLPRMEIRDFVESHGILIKLGDRSHPNAVEVIAEFTAAQEKVLGFVEQFGDLSKFGVRAVVGDKSRPEEVEVVKPLERWSDYSC